MPATFVAWAAVVVLAATSTVLLLSKDWRWALSLLAVLYLAAFALVAQYWPIGLAAVKLVTGWISTAALGMTRLNLPAEEDGSEENWLEGRPFRLFGAAIVFLTAFAAAPRVQEMIPGIGLPVTIGSLILIGVALLRLGTTSHLLRVVVSLLILLCGFETLYATVESSILVAALLSVVNLGLALTGSYLLMNSVPPEEEESL